MSDVELKLHVVESATEWIVVCDSPVGSARTRVPPPFTAAEVSSELKDLELSLIRSYSPVVTRRSQPPQKRALEFGSRLAGALLSDDVRMVLEGCRKLARETRGRLRVELEVNGSTVARIPWEFAVDPLVRDDFVALRFSFCRYLGVAAPMPPLEIEPPLRVLGVHAHTSDRDALAADDERAGVSALADVDPELVEVTWFEGDRWQDLSETLRGGGWHILHFIGHGGFSEEYDGGFVEIPRADGTAQRVPARLLGAAAAQTGDLRLVVLNSCEGAACDDSGTSSSTAVKLMEEGIPAVVAMQYEITDPAAVTFAQRFYEALATGKPVDQAVTDGRRSVLLTHRSLEWATPVLFLASREAELFRLPAPTDAPAPVDGPAPVPEQADDPTPVPQPVPTPVPEPATEPAVEPATEPPPRPESALHPLAETPTQVACERLVVGPRGMAAMACPDGTVRAWRLQSASWSSRCTLPRGVRCRALAWSPWPRHLATAQTDGTVAVWDLQQEIALRVLHPTTPEVAALAFTHSGDWLAVVGSDLSVEVFDASGVPRRRLSVPAPAAERWGRTAGVGPAYFEHGDRHLVLAVNQGDVVRLDVEGRLVTAWPHQHEVRAMALSDQRLVTWSVDERLRFWDLDGRLVQRVDEPSGAQLAFSADGRLLVSAGAGGRVRCWSAQGEQLAAAVAPGDVVGAGFWQDTIVTGTGAGVVQLWSLASHEAEPGEGAQR